VCSTALLLQRQYSLQLLRTVFVCTADAAVCAASYHVLHALFGLADQCCARCVYTIVYAQADEWALQGCGRGRGKPIAWLWRPAIADFLQECVEQVCTVNNSFNLSFVAANTADHALWCWFVSEAKQQRVPVQSCCSYTRTGTACMLSTWLCMQASVLSVASSSSSMALQ
jgi:hypothetical protein